MPPSPLLAANNSVRWWQAERSPFDSFFHGSADPTHMEGLCETLRTLCSLVDGRRRMGSLCGSLRAWGISSPEPSVRHYKLHVGGERHMEARCGARGVMIIRARDNFICMTLQSLSFMASSSSGEKERGHSVWRSELKQPAADRAHSQTHGRARENNSIWRTT